MIREAAQAIHKAHQQWTDLRPLDLPPSKAVKDESARTSLPVPPELPLSGLRLRLGQLPKKSGESSAEIFKQATLAAGKTKVICAGGSSIDPKAFLQQLHDRSTFPEPRQRNREQHPPETT
jgi:hypothetical protein